MHLNKSGTVTKATYRTMGSYDFVAMTRSVLLITVFITLRRVLYYKIKKTKECVILSLKQTTNKMAENLTIAICIPCRLGYTIHNNYF